MGCLFETQALPGHFTWRSSSYGPHETAALARSTQGLLSLLLALKIKPYVRFQVSRTHGGEWIHRAGVLCSCEYLTPAIRLLSRQASSDVCAAIARDITGTMGGERDLFTFQRAATGSPLLVSPSLLPPRLRRAAVMRAPLLPRPQLVLDRREDPVTPLLSQWTYQAMVHE